MNSLHISTSNAKTSQNNILKYRFKTPMQVDGYIALSSINVWYNWKNITAAAGNNTLSYKKKGESAVDIVLPDGSYSVGDLNNYLHYIMKEKGDLEEAEEGSEDEDKYGISLFENAVYNRISVVLLDDWEITFKAGLAKTLGALHRLTTVKATANLPFVPQLEPVKAVQVHCNLVSNKYQSDSSLLYNFTPNLSYGSLLSVEPRFPQWRATRNTEVREAEVWLTDQEGKALGLEDDWGVVLQVAGEQLIRL